MRKILTCLLSLFMLCTLLTFRVTASENAIIPSEADYTISGTNITGLSANFINSLDSTQKQNIELIIPGTIKGISITGISNNAFKSTNYSGCKFVKLDLSKMTSLKTIGEWAFYNNTSMQGNVLLPQTLTTISTHAFDGCSNLSGDLIIPDSVKTMGTYAFAGCSKMQGVLTLSNGLETISDYSFYNTGFTGELHIPSSIQTIGESAFRQGNAYNGFSGKLIIPDNVISVGKVAFAYQNAITDVQFSKNMTTIPSSMFRYCKGLKVVIIPEQIQTIGETAFAESGLITVYLPKIVNQSNTNFIKGNSFNTCSYLTAIICDKTDYQSIYSLLSGYTTIQNKLTYVKEIQLQDNNGNVYQPLSKLYNLPYNFVKGTDGIWTSSSQFTFPKVVGDVNESMGWTTTKGSSQILLPTTKVGNENIVYATKKLVDATVTFSDGIDKVYDGLSSQLSVYASHPDYVNINNAKEGDVVFYYTWRWATIGSSPNIQAGFDLNTLNLSEVYNPNYAIICQVIVQICHVENNKAVPFKTINHDFSFNLRQADPNINPIYKKSLDIDEGGLPDIQLSNGDTEGTITWDKGQTLQKGTHLYKWTFTPKANGVGSSNYKTVSGTEQVTAYRQYKVDVKNNGFGKVSPSDSFLIKEGDKTTLTFIPNNNYSISSLKINDKESVSRIINNQLTLENIQSDYIIEVKFEKKDIGKVEDIITQLPEIAEDKKPTQEQITSILEAKLSYENLGTTKDELSVESKKSFNELLSKLPQIEIKEQNQIIDNYMLLDNMSIEDVEILLNDPQATLSIDCELKPISSQQIGEEFKNIDKSIKLSECFDVQMVKVLSTKGNDTVTSLTNLSSPIYFSFAIPTNLPQLEKNYKREYYIVRIHENGQDKEITVLNNESLDDSQIVVKTDKFSLYAIAYKDIEISNGPEKPDIPTIPPIVELPDIVKPSNPNLPIDNESVKTGDEQNMTIWVILGTCSLVIGVAVILYKKKSKM